MSSGNDATAVDTWADELIDDDYTGVSSHHSSYRSAPNSPAADEQPSVPVVHLPPGTRLLLKHFSLYQDNHYVYGVLTGFEYDPDLDQCLVTTTNEHCLKIFSEVCSYLPLELMERVNCLDVDLDNPDKSYADILKGSLMVAEQSIKRNQNDFLSERKSMQLSSRSLDDFPWSKSKLGGLTRKLSLGFSCALCVIAPQKIYVANIGDTRVILCRKEFDGIRAEQISITHDWSNRDEIRRLESMGIHTDKIRMNNKNAIANLTRCLGNFLVKTSNAEFFDTSDEEDSPILSEPSIHSVPNDGSISFLILASASLIRLCQDALDKDNVIGDLAQMVGDKLFTAATTLKKVPDLVINELYKRLTERYQRPPETHYKPILLIRTFPSGDQLQTINNSEHAAANELHQTITHSIHDSIVSNLELPNEEIKSYVDFTPILDALQNIDYDKFLSSSLSPS